MAFCRSMGMHDQAAVIEAQMKQQRGATATAQPAQATYPQAAGTQPGMAFFKASFYYTRHFSNRLFFIRMKEGSCLIEIRKEDMFFFSFRRQTLTYYSFL